MNSGLPGNGKKKEGELADAFTIQTLNLRDSATGIVKKHVIRKVRYFLPIMTINPLCANRNKSCLLFLSAEMFKKPLWQTVWTQIRLAPIGAVCSGATLFASLLNSSVMLGNYLQQTTFSDAFFFLGSLRVKISGIPSECQTIWIQVKPDI